PRSHAAEKRDEIASPHSITSSAATSSLSGTVRPSIRAVRALMTNSNFDDLNDRQVRDLSTLENPAGIDANLKARPSAQRTSIATVRPSIQPSSRSRRTNTANHGRQGRQAA